MSNKIIRSFFLKNFNNFLNACKQTTFKILKMNNKESCKRVLDDGTETESKKLCSEAENVGLQTVEKGIPWRKVIIMLSYCGQGYYGMQRNLGYDTIEEKLLTALFKSGCITREALITPQVSHFQRAARTDKNVSAARQVVSIKMPMYPDAVERINSHLPAEIRVMAIKRVTKNFNCKLKCDGRTYTYTMPTFAFTPLEQATKEDFRISEELLQKVSDILKEFKGTHNFHNYTARRKAEDPSCQRYIMQFECSQPFIRKDLEFVTIKVKGQSFMLHQIRKMIGVTIAIIRGMASPDIIEKAWTLDRVDIPIAPALGLLLEEIHYDAYNRKFGGDGMHETLTWDSINDRVEEFKENFINSKIFEGEKEEKSMLSWLSTLTNHTFDVRGEDIPNSQSQVRTEIGRAAQLIVIENQKLTSSNQQSSK